MCREQGGMSACKREVSPATILRTKCIDMIKKISRIKAFDIINIDLQSVKPQATKYDNNII